MPAFLRLQATTPGTPQTAHANVSGTVIAAGTIACGTGNFTVNKTATGTYTVTVTPETSTPRMFGVVNPGNGGF